MTEIMVRQWSFCTKCKGLGCPECGSSGTTVKLIPLKSLLKGAREEYTKAQADFIKEQEEAQEVK